ncbi:MAG: meiotic nuclear division protein 1-like protein [Amphiamblys sp. WSBS2006]|nr:MAG: meiotic nuclear division protein 1-like protein [Amphiamblys sp. WSBS2006]
MVKKVSVDEKREKIIAFFEEHPQPWGLKELETLLPKKKGISQMKVKEMVEAIAVDGAINQEKVGIGNFFWRFPGAAAQQRKSEIRRLEAEISGLEEENRASSASVQAERALRVPSEKRSGDLEEHRGLLLRKEACARELASLRELDPDRYAASAARRAELGALVERWTDNLFVLQAYCEKTFSMSRSDLCTQFDIFSNLDYLS